MKKNLVWLKEVLFIVGAIIIGFIFSMIGENVGVVHDIIYPTTYIEIPMNEQITIKEIGFNSLFFEKRIINWAYNEETISFKIRDKDKKIVDKGKLKSGKSMKLKGVKRFQTYYLEVSPVKKNIDIVLA